MTADVALLALCAAFALHQANARALFAVCVVAPLVRETGILLPAPPMDAPEASKRCANTPERCPSWSP